MTMKLKVQLFRHRHRWVQWTNGDRITYRQCSLCSHREVLVGDEWMLPGG